MFPLGLSYIVPRRWPLLENTGYTVRRSRHHSRLLLAGVQVSRPVFLCYSHLVSFQILLHHHRGLLLLLRPQLPRVVLVVVFILLPLKLLVSDLTPSLFP